MLAMGGLLMGTVLTRWWAQNKLLDAEIDAVWRGRIVVTDPKETPSATYAEHRD